MMATNTQISGRAAPIRIENLDTDQIIPKQFLRGIDKSGLVEGLLYDLRCDAKGQPRPDFVLNQPAYADASILIGGANFGCGSSREHAVWALLQAGVRAIVAPSFGEIFYSNAMGNQLMLVMLPLADIEVLMQEVEADPSAEVVIDVQALQVRSARLQRSFAISQRHRQMFLEGLDVIGLTLTHQAEIDAFTRQHWHKFPWMRDVAQHAKARLEAY